jgi:hypothetical protein
MMMMMMRRCKRKRSPPGRSTTTGLTAQALDDDDDDEEEEEEEEAAANGEMVIGWGHHCSQRKPSPPQFPNYLAWVQSQDAVVGSWPFSTVQCLKTIQAYKIVS